MKSITAEVSIQNLKGLNIIVSDVLAACKTAKESYGSAMETLTPNINTIVNSFTGVWEDEVSSALIDSIKDIPTSCFAYIYNDMALGGGLGTLIKTLESLYLKIAELIDTKQKADNKAIERGKLNPVIDGKPNPKDTQLASEIRQLKGAIPGLVTDINAMLKTISELQLGSNLSSPGTQQSSSGGGATEQPQKTEQQEAPARPTRAELEADGTYNSNGGRDGAHFTTYQDYLEHLRRYNLQLDPNSTEYDVLYRASVDGTNTMMTPSVYIAEFNSPPYVVDGVRQGDPVEMWRAEQTQILQDRARLGV